MKLGGAMVVERDIECVTVNGRVEVQSGCWFFLFDVKLFLNFQWLRELQTELANWHS